MPMIQLLLQEQGEEGEKGVLTCTSSLITSFPQLYLISYVTFVYLEHVLLTLKTFLVLIS
jgi:hypothetical protein